MRPDTKQIRVCLQSPVIAAGGAGYVNTIVNAYLQPALVFPKVCCGVAVVFLEAVTVWRLQLVGWLMTGPPQLSQHGIQGTLNKYE